MEREFPDISVSTSADVFPSIREYERWTTTVINACTRSILKTYLFELDTWLKDNGFIGKLYLLVSDGGMVNIDIARQYPVRMLASGSAASALMCGEISKSYNGSDLLMFDMGGTSAKLGIIKNGKARKRYDVEVGRIHQNKKGSGLPVFTPVFDLAEIAAGGCSICRHRSARRLAGRTGKYGSKNPDQPVLDLVENNLQRLMQTCYWVFTEQIPFRGRNKSLPQYCRTGDNKRPV